MLRTSMTEEIMIWKKQWRGKEDTSPGLKCMIYGMWKYFFIERTAGNVISRRKTISLKEHVKGKFSNEFESIWYLMSRQSREQSRGRSWERKTNQLHWWTRWWEWALRNERVSREVVYSHTDKQVRMMWHLVDFILLVSVDAVGISRPIAKGYWPGQ